MKETDCGFGYILYFILNTYDMYIFLYKKVVIKLV